MELSIGCQKLINDIKGKIKKDSHEKCQIISNDYKDKKDRYFMKENFHFIYLHYIENEIFSWEYLNKIFCANICSCKGIFEVLG